MRVRLLYIHRKRQGLLKSFEYSGELENKTGKGVTGLKNVKREGKLDHSSQFGSEDQRDQGTRGPWNHWICDEVNRNLSHTRTESHLCKNINLT